MHIPQGTPEQAQMRALTGYAGAPLGARHRTTVLCEARAWLPRLPADALTLEIVVQANDPGLLEAMEQFHGLRAYRGWDLPGHRIWNQMRLMGTGPGVRAHLAARLMEARPELSQDVAAKLAIDAGSCDNPELLRTLLERFDTPAFLSDILGHSLIGNSPALAACAEMVATRLARRDMPPDACCYLTQRLHEQNNPRGIAALAKAGLAVPLSPEYLAPGRGELAREIMAKLSSAHGRLALMQSLPPLPDILRADKPTATALLRGALAS